MPTDPDASTSREPGDATTDDPPGLVLGPLLRWIDEESATVWVETDTACTVTVLGDSSPTFEAAGHHYALVTVDLTDRARVAAYDVRLDGELVWPPPAWDWPAPVLRRPHGSRSRIVFGSCRAAAPDEEPWELPGSDHRRGIGRDALVAWAHDLVDRDHADWPDLVLLLGDQVYADAASPETRAFARERRDTSQPPGEDVADFEEYTRLYRESWGKPAVRWLLSTVPTAMIFDDHDVIDDWNISAPWLDDMRATDWWHDRIVGALVSYWIYQHLGNLSPAALAEEPLLARIRDTDGDAAALLWSFAEGADRHPETARWSHHRRIGDTDVVVVDSRAGRVLREERDMLDEPEWDWLTEVLADPAADVLVATTLPVLLPEAIHDVEVWNARVCDGAWGERARGPGETIRRAVDLEHWAAFHHSAERLLDLLHDVVAHPDVRTVALLSGDVHNGSIDRARWDDLDEPLWQIVASPMRQEIEQASRHAFTVARSPVGRAVGRLLRASVDAPRLPVRWRTVDGPVFANHLGTIELDESEAVARLHVAGDGTGLVTAVERRLR